ncbi:MAG: hypothetical protein RR365_11170, partial [Bacteroides sp.]
MEAADRLLMFQQYKSKEIGGINKFEVYCGLSMGCIANAAKNNRSVSTRTVGKIKKRFPELNMNWVIAGDGDMNICDEY